MPPIVCRVALKVGPAAAAAGPAVGAYVDPKGWVNVIPGRNSGI